MSAPSAELEHLPEEFEHPPHEVEAAVAPLRRGRIMRIGSTVVSVVFLAAAAWWVSKQKMPSIPSGTHAYLSIAGALALYALATICRGERWHRLLRHTSIHPKRRDSWAITTVGYAGNVDPEALADGSQRFGAEVLPALR